MPREFENRHVVVTGGTGALGCAVVQALLEQGAHVHVPCFHLREIERAPFRDDPRVRIEAGIDLRSGESAEGFYAGVPAGTLWASLHLAGGFMMKPLERTRRDDFADLLMMNALTTFLCCREAAARMGPSGGRLVNVASRPALEPRLGAGMSAYTASKAAVAALTAALAAELADQGVLVNAVAPSIMDTPANRAAMPDADHSRWPKVEDVARAILALASPANTLISGAVVPIYGRA